MGLWSDLYRAWTEETTLENVRADRDNKERGQQAAEQRAASALEEIARNTRRK